jgi:tRNA(fMet)-specific endonuclease VapC
MMHLDANVVIGLFRKRNHRLRSRFDAEVAAGARLRMSMIVYHELMYGAALSSRRSENERAIAALLTMAQVELLDFEADDARDAADIRAEMHRLGSPIGPYDVLIAGQARRAKVPLVTANTSEFSRVPGLSVVDWSLGE